APEATGLDVLELDEDALQGLKRRSRPGLGKEQGKLVAAHATGEIVHARPLADQATHRDEHGVTRGIAALEVELAKAVYVGHCDREGMAVALGPRDVELQLGPERREAQQRFGERVALLKARQLCLELADPLACGGKL